MDQNYMISCCSSGKIYFTSLPLTSSLKQAEFFDLQLFQQSHCTDCFKADDRITVYQVTLQNDSLYVILDNGVVLVFKDVC